MTEIQKLDSLMSNFVRELSGWQCERCSKRFIPPTVFLQCAHFIPRANKATRFDPNNCVALCIDCHKFFDGSGRKEFDQFMERRLGSGDYQLLLQKGRSIKKEAEAVAEAREWLAGDKSVAL